jgi:hypothetical protein
LLIAAVVIFSAAIIVLLAWLLFAPTTPGAD